MEQMILVRSGAADAIKHVMEDEKLNQTDLAKLAGTSRQSVQQCLGQKSKNMRVATMAKFLDAMGYELAVIKKEGA